MAVRFSRSPFLGTPVSSISINLNRPTKFCRFSVQNHSVQHSAYDTNKLILQVKEKLKKDHPSLPVGKNGRDDDDMILWFLKDRKFSVEETVAKLCKAISWREEFKVSELTEQSVKNIAKTGKAYLHDFLDVSGRPVLIVVAAKHFPAMQDPAEDKKLCAFLVEKALSRLPPGKNEILGIVDLRGFSTENADLNFIKFLFDVFYYYYPKRLAQVLFVDAPFIFKPVWQLVKPLLKSYASLVRFISLETLKKEYFTEETLPIIFKDTDTEKTQLFPSANK